MKIFITKWWETRGIEEAVGKLASFSTPERVVIETSWDYGCLFYPGRTCFYTRKEAVEYVQKQAAKKISAYRLKTARLEKIVKNGL